MADPAPYDPAKDLSKVIGWACRQGSVELPARLALRSLRHQLNLHDTPYATEVEDALRTAWLLVHRARARRAAEAHVVQLLAGMTEQALDDALAMLEHTNPAGLARLRAHLNGAEAPRG